MNVAVQDSRRQIIDTFGSHAAFRAAGDDLFVLKQGSALVMLHVEEWDDKAVVRCVAQVVQGARVDGALAGELLRLNAHLRFGAFSWWPDGNVVLLSHTMLGGDALDPRTLLAAVRDVALVADEYDDTIVARFGGRRVTDLVEDADLRKILAESPDAFSLKG